MWCHLGEESHHVFPLSIAHRVEVPAQQQASGLSLCQVLRTRNRLCQHWPSLVWPGSCGKQSKQSSCIRATGICFYRYSQQALLLQLAADPAVMTLGRDAIKAVLAGASYHFAKPMLAAEVRRIMPTAAGLPMELSLCTAAVAAAAVQGEYNTQDSVPLKKCSCKILMYLSVSIVKATTSPALPENYHIGHLLKTNVQFHTEIRPR